MNNLNETILLVSAIQGFLLILGLITKKTKNKLSNIAIGLIIFIISIEMLFSWGSATEYNNLPEAIPFWVLKSYLLIPASIWLFFEVNTNPIFKFDKKCYLIFLPAILDICIQFTISFFPHIIDNQIFTLLINSQFLFFFGEILPLFATIIILFFYAKRLILLKKKLMLFKNLALQSYFQKIFSILFILSFFIIIWTASTYYLVQFKIIEITLVSLIFLLGYIAYFKPDFFEIPKDILLKSQNLNAFQNYDDMIELKKLNKAFTESHLHRRPKLTVADLANELKLPVKYVSFLISNYHSKNFNDFINSFRVEEVIRKMADPAEKYKSLLGIALEAGFNSKSSFNQVFKQHTGKTPSEY